MLLQEGIVNEKKGSKVLVESENTNSCNNCAMSKKCMMSDDKKTCKIWVQCRDIDVNIGDMVVVEYYDNYFLKLSVLLYLLPSIVIIVLAITGYLIAVKYSFNSDILTGLGFVTGFVSYILFLVFYNNYKKEKNSPKIIKILNNNK